MDQITKLLIVGASNKSTRSIARSLKKYNCETYVLHDVDLAVSKSRYISEYSIMKASADINSYKNEIITAIKKYNIDLVLPSTDIALDVILNFKGEVEKHSKVIGLNPPEAYKYAHDKFELLKLGEKVGLKAPAYVYVDDVNMQLPEFVFPVIVKPVSSARIVNGKHFNYKVILIKSKEQLIDVIREVVPSTPVMIQEYIDGYGIGYNIFCIDGEVKSEFIHKRLNENAGVSSYRKIIPVDSYGIKERVHQLLKETKWNGVGMVEFKVDKNNVPYLMEMNGRFFGSTELGVKAGYDLPGFLFSTQYLGKPQIINNTGKYYSLRLLHDEILLEYAALFKTLNIARFLKWKFSLFNIILPGNFFEDNFFNDPHFVFNLYKYDLKRVSSKKQNRRQVNAIKIKPINGVKFRSAKRVVFVCLGNICRSPFAEQYSKKLFPDKLISSTGTFYLENRFSPVNAVAAAKKYGVDLSDHQSKSLDNSLTTEDVYIVMDKMNYHALLKAGIPDSQLYFLSDKEIADPYKKSIFEFEKSYSEIKDAIDKL